MTTIHDHLVSRHCDPARYPKSVSTQGGEASFWLYNFSGQLVGVQYYNKDYPKKDKNPKLCKYFTRLQDGMLGVWGLETFDKHQPYLFVVEGVFDAARLHSMGHNAIATLTNNPLKLAGFLKCLPQYSIALCDGDKAGEKLRNVTNSFVILPHERDVSDLPRQQLEEILESSLHLHGFT